MKAGTMSGALATFALISGNAFAQSTPVIPADLKSAAVALGHAYDEGYAQKSPEAMAAVYALDGTLVSPSGKVIKGHDALLDYYKKRFAEGAQHHHIEVQTVQPLGKNSAYSLSKFSMEEKDAQGILIKRSGNLMAIYEHTKLGWRLQIVEPSIPPKG